MGNVLTWMARYAGGSVPADTDPQYANWVRGIQTGQQDAANRGNWRRLLIREDLVITADEEDVELPDKFFKVNGIYVLDVNGVDWNAPSNEDAQRLWVFMDTDGTWKLRLLGFIPNQTVTAKLWYFYNPPIPTAEEDPLLLDGEMVGFYSLKEHFRETGELGSMDDARLEYENRREELLTLETLPSPQELIEWGSHSQFRNEKSNERRYYSGKNLRRRY